MGILKNLRRERQLIAFDLQQHLKDVRAFARGEDHKLIAEGVGGAPDPATPKRVAVVATCPSDVSLFCTLNLVKALTDSGFYVLAISNKRLADTDRKQLLAQCHYLIERYNVGRDFGAYKIGIRWFADKGMLDKADYLALTNDSMFYTKSFSKQLAEFLTVDEQWYALFENYETHYHAQSFFQVFRKDVFNSASFRGFWNDYKPYSSRRHAIDQGEVLLSWTLRKAGFHVGVLYSSDRVCADVRKALSREPWDRDVVFALKHSMGHSFYSIADEDKNAHVFEQTMIAEFDREVYVAAAADDLVHCLAHQIEVRNPTHSVALLCNILYEAPIKRDVVYRGVIHLGTLLTHCRGFDDQEKRRMRDDMKMRGTPQSLTYSLRLVRLARTGRI
jgi:hypothetical protein